MKFKKIAIVGLGLIGGSLAAAFKRKQIANYLIGIDYQSIVEKALNRKLVNEGYGLEDLNRGIHDADLIILATPIREILALIPNVVQHVKQGALITDVGSTKEKIVQTALNCLTQGVYFLGGHPMTGSENRGLENADPFLFENAIYVLTENHNVPNVLVESLVEMLETIGAKVFFLPAKTHDEIAGMVSHLPQIIAVTLMYYVSKLSKSNDVFLNLAAGGFRDMTRVAMSPYEIWTDIIGTNEKNIREAIDQFIKELESIKELLSDRELEYIFKQAAQHRLAIPKDMRGFLRPHFDISVVVEDKPGMIAAISTILAQENINIKDIEVMKVREREAGMLRLAFESEKDRERSINLLVKNGFQVSMRD
ncbi:MAG: prephenate dehydrogenase/arogenate dehydrogenase family protein [bacterium]